MTLHDKRGPIVCELAANADERRRNYAGNMRWYWIPQLDVGENGAYLVHRMADYSIVFAPQADLPAQGEGE